VPPRRIADSLLQRLYRWVSSPASPLHDPDLHRHLLNLQHKLFLQLCAEMRRLGAVIVAASPHSITLCTGKRSVRAAAGYTRFLLDALRSRELFRWLGLSPSAWYHAYLFRDAYNWAGLESGAAAAEWAALEAGGAAAGARAGEGEEGGGEEEAAAGPEDNEAGVKWVWV
ncbi:DNA polymerase epsilon catalytic subunit A, partial [Tetrabaena socialis]